MKTKPVLKQLKILRILLTQDIGVNTVFKQTGLTNKKAVTDAISELEKAQLLGEREDPNHSQREIMYLTDSGKEVADMIISLDEFAKSIYKLYAVAKEKVLFVTGRYLGILDIEDVEEMQLIHNKRDFQNALRVLGWPDDEIIVYNSCRTNVVDLISFCERNFLNVLLLRYSLILHSFKLNNKAKTIISNIILNAINEKVSFMLDNIQDETLGYSTIKVHNPIRKKRMPTVRESGSSGGIFQLFGDIVAIITEIPLPFVIKEEIRNVLIAYLALLKPPLTNLDFYIWNIMDFLEKDIDFLNETGGKTGQEGKDVRFNKLSIKGTQFFLETYREYCSRRNYYCECLNKLDRLA